MCTDFGIDGKELEAIGLKADTEKLPDNQISGALKGFAYEIMHNDPQDLQDLVKTMQAALAKKSIPTEELMLLEKVHEKYLPDA